MNKLSFWLLVLLVVSAFDFVYAGSQKQDFSGASGSSDRQRSQAIAAPGSIKYPVAGGAAPLKFWKPMHNRVMQYYSNYKDLPVFQELQKRTGIAIEWIHPVFSQEREQFNIMMASGDLPDIIMSADYYTGGLLKGYEDGVYIDLLPYLGSNAPDYYALINSSMVAQKQTYIDDKVLAFYYIKPGNPPYHRPLLRKDFLKEFGMNPPRTYDEWEVYFNNVKSKKPGIDSFHINFNDKNDMDVWLGGYDMLYDWYVINGKVAHYYDGRKYPEFLARMNKWYESGYITKDFLSLNSNQLFTLYDNLMLAAYTGSVDNVKIRLDPRNLFNVVESAPYPRLTLGQKLHTGIPMWPVDPNLTGATAITSQCKEIENAVKLLNYGYTEEGHKLFDYGIEGVTYNMVNGKVVFTEFLINPPEGKPVGSTYKYHIYPKFADPDTLTFASFQAQEGGVEWRLKWNDDPDVDDSYRMLPVTLSPRELEEVTEIMVDVTAYADEMKLKFITGAESLSNYNAYIQRLNSMNFQRAKQIYQAAYDRLMN